jgi:aquaporin Z
MNNTNKYIVELIGTFFLVLVIGLTAEPLAIGSILMALVYMGGHVSGAHYNPAVTLGVLLRKKITLNEAVMYMIFQLIGSFLAAVVIYLVIGSTFYPKPKVDYNYFDAIILELLFSFVLVSVVLNTATTKKNIGNSFFGLAIGFTVLAGAYAIGPWSGGAMNPAVAAGTIIFNLFFTPSAIKYLPIYIAGPFLGAIIAAAIFKFTNKDEFDAPRA